MLPNGFVIPTLAGAGTIVVMPNPGDSELEAMSLFGSASSLISEEWHNRDKAKAEHSEWLHKVCYQLLSMMISHGFSGLFDQRIANFDRKHSAASNRVNPFQKGLLAAFAHDKGIIDDRSRHYLAIRLWYAYRHYVPHEFLSGFFHQVWTKGAQQRSAAGSIEPDFEMWIILQRAINPISECRGQYPTALETKVEQARKVCTHLRG